MTAAADQGHHETPSAESGVPATMTAIVQDAYGTDHLRLARVAVPRPGPGEVLIQVHAAGVDRGVWHLAVGLPLLLRVAGFGLRRPKTPTPGLDVAGRVVAVGAGVTRFRVGEDVFGIGRGTFAEFAVAEAAKLAPKPARASFEEAGVAAISGITALQALTDVGRVQAGHRVLVTGASGGVGSFAVQIAHALGATVTGVASGRKAHLVRSLGAERVIDYETSDYLDGSDHYDLIIDIGGRSPVRSLRRALTRAGTLVIVGGEGGGRVTGGFGRQFRASALSPFVPQRLTTFVSPERAADIERLGRMIDDGDVTPAIGSRYALAQAREALADLAAGRTEGKSVVVVRSA